jgi:NitT/TauT family transport system substrate-binding protein
MNPAPWSGALAPLGPPTRAAAGVAAIVFLAAAASLLAAGCSASPTESGQAARTHRLVLKEESATRERLAVAADGGGQVFRLGLVPQLADAAGLVGAGLGYFQQDLGGSVRLQVVPFTSQAAEGDALAAGRLDGAYMNPVMAVQVWLASGRKLIKVVAGAAVSRNDRGGGTTSAVFVVTTGLLRTRPGVVAAMLKGQIQAEQMLGTEPARALPVIGAELAALGHRRVSDRLLAQSFAAITFTNDPLVSSVLAQASSAAAGLIKPLPSLAGLYDLGPLDTWLRAAGQPQVPG